jgi:hypothetical protein
MAAALHQLGSGIFDRAKNGAITGTKVNVTQQAFAITTAMIDDVGDLIPLAPATQLSMLSGFRLTITDVDTGGPTLVWSLVLTNAASIGTLSGALTYTVIASITAGQTATTYDLATQSYAIKVAAQQKKVNNPSGAFCWALLVATAATTPAAGTAFFELSEIEGHPSCSSNTIIPYFS